MQRTGALRPGGRTARTERAVHAAVRDLIAAGEGRPAVSAIAERAGVSAATIYRRWGGLDGLLLDVAAADAHERAPIPASGDLRRDLLVYARQLHHQVAQPGGLGLLRAMIAVGNSPDGGPQQVLELLRDRLEGFQALIDASTEGTSLTVVDLIDGLLAPVYLRALLSQPSTLTEDDLRRLVDNLVLVDSARKDADPAATRDGSRTPSTGP